MEYLMTYGWAILIVIIVAAALYSLGVFNPATWTGSRATGFTNIGAPATGAWKLSATAASNQFQVKLGNNLPSRIKVTLINVTIGATPCTGESIGVGSPPVMTQLDDAGSGNSSIEGIGASFNIYADCGEQTAGSTYTGMVTLTYDNLDTELTGFKESGTITGTVS